MFWKHAAKKFVKLAKMIKTKKYYLVPKLKNNLSFLSNTQVTLRL